MSSLSFITAHQQQQHYIGPSSSVAVHHLNTARRCGDTLLHHQWNKRQTSSLRQSLILNLSLQQEDEENNNILSSQFLPPKALHWSIAASAAAAISYADRGALD